MNSFAVMISRVRSYFPAVSKDDQLLARTAILLVSLVTLCFIISSKVLFGLLVVASTVIVFIMAFISPVEDTPSEDD